MTKGAPAQMKEQLGLAEPSYFNYLSVSGEYAADGVDDIAEFKEMERAMDVCQISPVLCRTYSRLRKMRFLRSFAESCI